MAEQNKQFIVIGGGFSGIALTSQLIDKFQVFRESTSDAADMTITIVDPKKQMGGNTFNRYHVSVPMANPIGVLGLEHEGDFVDYINHHPAEWRQIAPELPYDEKTGFDPTAFVTHNQYGFYLRERLQDLMNAHNGTDSHVTVKIKSGAEALDGWMQDSHAHIRLSNGEILQGDAIVLATGNVEPKPLPGLGGTKGYYNLDDRGLAPENVNETDHTVLIGTGNGAHFAVFSALVNGYKGRFTLASNNGLTPQVAGPTSRPYQRQVLTVEKLEAQYAAGKDITAKQLKNLFLRERVTAEKNGYSWREVVDSLIPDTNRIWGLLSRQEKLNFVNNYGFFWGHARFRIPQEHHDLITRLQNEKVTADDGSEQPRLQIRGGVFSVSPSEAGGFDVLIDSGRETYDVVHTDKIINNTGPSGKIEHMSSIMKAFERRQLVAQHPLGGVECDEQMHLLGTNTTDPIRLYGIGPILKGEIYESITVPAIRSLAGPLSDSMLRDHFNMKSEGLELEPEEEGVVLLATGSPQVFNDPGAYTR